MGQIKTAVRDKRAIYQQFGIYEKYDSPKSYTMSESYFGEGQYPPDWSQRREAIWWLQNNNCGRCGRYRKHNGNTHHIRPLSKNGSNDLHNLIGLCVDCHKLLHPNITNLNGSVEDAPTYPCPEAEQEVAVVKKEGYTDSANLNLDDDFERLATRLEPDKNRYAADSPAVYTLDALTAKTFSHDPFELQTDIRDAVRQTLETQLIQQGLIPRNEAHNPRELAVKTPIQGFLGRYSNFHPSVSIGRVRGKEERNQVLSLKEQGENRKIHRFKFTGNVSQVTVEVTDSDGEAHQKVVQFTDDEPTRSITIPVSRPSSAGSYMRSSARALRLPQLGAIVGVLMYFISALLFIPIAGLLLLLGTLGIWGAGLLFIVSSIQAIFFNGAWRDVAALAGGLVGMFIMNTIAVAILEFYGIEL